MKQTAHRSAIAGLVVVLLTTGCSSPPPSSEWDRALESADSAVAEWVARGTVPGAVLLVTLHGEPALHTVHGYAQAWDFGGGQYPDASVPGPTRTSTPRPMRPETLFDLASVTKVMATTFAVMMLVNEGAIELDVPASQYLPDFTGGGKKAITVRHLLTHRSGLAQWKPTYYHAESADEAYDLVRELELQWPVGVGRHYSDLGFMVLGRIVEAVSGTPLDAFLATRVYGPLGLRRTDFGPVPPDAAPPEGIAATSHGNPFERRMVHDSSFGYSIEGDPDRWNDWRRYTLVGEVNDGNAHHAFGGVAGHAGLFSTAPELADLLALLLRNGSTDGFTVADSATVADFLRAGPDNQALGWQTPDYVPETGFSHTGFTGTFVMGVRATGLGVVLLTNRQHAGVDDQTSYPDIGPLQRFVAETLSDAAASVTREGT